MSGLTVPSTGAEETQAQQKLARQQKLRMRLVGQTSLTYVIDALLLSLFAAAGMTSFLCRSGPGPWGYCSAEEPHWPFGGDGTFVSKTPA